MIGALKMYQSAATLLHIVFLVSERLESALSAGDPSWMQSSTSGQFDLSLAFRLKPLNHTNGLETSRW
ncbi:unnamed protein product [Calypogeia fissa]